MTDGGSSPSETVWPASMRVPAVAALEPARQRARFERLLIRVSVVVGMVALYVNFFVGLLGGVLLQWHGAVVAVVTGVLILIPTGVGSAQRA